MNRIVFTALVLLGISVSSCDVGEEEPYYIQISAVSEVTNPAKYAKDSITNIPIMYSLPSKCNMYNGLYYDANDLQRVVAIESIRKGNKPCDPDDQVYSETLRFKPAQLGTYHFKFYLGKNDQGVEQFYEFDAIVDH